MVIHMCDVLPEVFFIIRSTTNTRINLHVQGVLPEVWDRNKAEHFNFSLAGMRLPTNFLKDFNDPG